jgi:hypothetical protein
MKRYTVLLGFTLAWLFSLTMDAQTVAYNGFCAQGATPAVTSGLQSSNSLLGLIPQCTVTVYLTGTSIKATIYADSISTPLTNPFTATSTASWIFYAATGEGYDVTMSGGLPPNVFPYPVTLTDLQYGGGGGGGGGTVTSFSAPAASWPSYLVPTVTNQTTNPVLTVAASTIPISAGGTGATTANGAMTNLGMTQTGAVGSTSQADVLPGSLDVSVLNNSIVVLPNGSNDLGVPVQNALASCSSTLGCNIEIGPLTSYSTLSEPWLLIGKNNVHILCDSPAPMYTTYSTTALNPWGYYYNSPVEVDQTDSFTLEGCNFNVGSLAANSLPTVHIFASSNATVNNNHINTLVPISSVTVNGSGVATFSATPFYMPSGTQVLFQNLTGAVSALNGITVSNTVLSAGLSTTQFEVQTTGVAAGTYAQSNGATVSVYPNGGMLGIRTEGVADGLGSVSNHVNASGNFISVPYISYSAGDHAQHVRFGPDNHSDTSFQCYDFNGSGEGLYFANTYLSSVVVNSGVATLNIQYDLSNSAILPNQPGSIVTFGGLTGAASALNGTQATVLGTGITPTSVQVSTTVANGTYPQNTTSYSISTVSVSGGVATFTATGSNLTAPNYTILSGLTGAVSVLNGAQAVLTSGLTANQFQINAPSVTSGTYPQSSALVYPMTAYYKLAYADAWDINFDNGTCANDLGPSYFESARDSGEHNNTYQNDSLGGTGATIRIHNTTTPEYNLHIDLMGSRFLGTSAQSNAIHVFQNAQGVNIAPAMIKGYGDSGILLDSTSGSPSDINITGGSFVDNGSLQSSGHQCGIELLQSSGNSVNYVNVTGASFYNDIGGGYELYPICQTAAGNQSVGVIFTGNQNLLGPPQFPAGCTGCSFPPNSTGVGVATPTGPSSTTAGTLVGYADTNGTQKDITASSQLTPLSGGGIPTSAGSQTWETNYYELTSNSTAGNTYTQTFQNGNSGTLRIEAYQSAFPVSTYTAQWRVNAGTLVLQFPQNNQFSTALFTVSVSGNTLSVHSTTSNTRIDLTVTGTTASLSAGSATGTFAIFAADYLTANAGLIDTGAAASSGENCLQIDTSGNITNTGTTCGSGGGGTNFASLTNGTNTSATMIVGTGASLSTSGSGTITATSAGTATNQSGGTVNATTLAASGSVTLTGIEAASVTSCLQISTSGVVTNTGTACGSGSSSISGMTAGQVAIAGSATTITSSMPLAGTGAGITTGPSSSVSGDVVTFTGTSGQVQDSGTLLSSLAPLVSPSFTTPALGTPTSGVITNLTGTCSNCTVTNANNIYTTGSQSSGSTFYVPFAPANSSSDQALSVNSGLTYQPSTGTLSATIGLFGVGTTVYGNGTNGLNITYLSGRSFGLVPTGAGLVVYDNTDSIPLAEFSYNITSLGNNLPVNLVGTTTPFQMNGSAGTSGQCLLSGGSGVTPNWGTCAGGGTTTNALTFNNGGSGASSGSTFNGSSAVTVSYNTIGAASSGANSNITSLTGLTTALGAAYGGSGELGTITGILYGNGSSAFTQATASQANLLIQGITGCTTANYVYSPGNSSCSAPTGTATNSLTFNNGGAGASSGTSFNGSSAVTVSYNTIGASPTAGNTSLVTLGTVTTGTWDGTAITPTYGGTGLNSSSSSGVAQVSSGTWSVSTTLPSGLSATNITLTTPILGTPQSGVITNLTGTCTSCTAANATNIATTGSQSSASTYYVPFAPANSSSNQALSVNGSLTYQPSTGSLTVAGLSVTASSTPSLYINDTGGKEFELQTTTLGLVIADITDSVLPVVEFYPTSVAYAVPINLINASSPLEFQSSAGSSGQLPISQGASTTPIWGDVYADEVWLTALCQGGTAYGALSYLSSGAPNPFCRAGTNNTGGYLQFTSASQLAQFVTSVPHAIDTGGSVYPVIKFTATQGADVTTSHIQEWQVQAYCSTTTDDVSWPTAVTSNSFTVTSTANTPVSNGGKYYLSATLNAANWPSACYSNPGAQMFFQIGTASANTNTTANLSTVTIEWPLSTPGKQ